MPLVADRNYAYLIRLHVSQANCLVKILNKNRKQKTVDTPALAMVFGMGRGMVLVVPVLMLVLARLPCHAGGADRLRLKGCASDQDCSLNGVCDTGACACDTPWAGRDCGVLTFAPVHMPQG